MTDNGVDLDEAGSEVRVSPSATTQPIPVTDKSYCVAVVFKKDTGRIGFATEHLSLEILYDPKEINGELYYRRSYYIDHVPGDAAGNYFTKITRKSYLGYPMKGTQRGPRDSDRLQGVRAAAVVAASTSEHNYRVIRGLNFPAMKDKINAIFTESHPALQEARYIPDGGASGSFVRKTAGQPSGDTMGESVKSTSSIMWALCRYDNYCCCGPGKAHSCTTIVNDILRAGGVKLDKVNGESIFYAAFFLVITALIGFVIAASIDLIDDVNKNNLKKDVLVGGGGGLLVGLFLLFVCGGFTSRLGTTDFCGCCGGSPCRKPASLWWQLRNLGSTKRADASDIMVESSEHLPLVGAWPKRYNSPVGADVTGASELAEFDGGSKYDKHVCAL